MTAAVAVNSTSFDPSQNEEVILLEFQHLAASVQCFLSAFPESKNQTKCKLILRAALRGALNLRARVDDRLLGKKRETSSDEAEILKTLCGQFQIVGDPSFRLIPFDRRKRAIAADCAEVWLRAVQSDMKFSTYRSFSQFVGFVPKGHTAYSWSNSEKVKLSASDCTGADTLLRIVVHTRAIEENFEFRRDLLKEQVAE